MTDRHELQELTVTVTVPTFVLEDPDSWRDIADLAWHEMWDLLNADHAQQ